MSLLEGKVAVITGASSGIGRAVALMFAEHGAAVVLAARRQARLDEVANEIRSKGGRAYASAGDIALPKPMSGLLRMQDANLAASTSPSTMPAPWARRSRWPKSRRRTGNTR